MMMWTDPVVNEIHQIRQQMLADAGGDFHVFMEKIRSEQAASRRMIIESPITRLPTRQDVAPALPKV
jgi:hypothetical protein